MGPITAFLGLFVALAGLTTLLGRQYRTDTDDAVAVFGLSYVWAFGAIVGMVCKEFFPHHVPPVAFYFNPAVDLMFGVFMLRIHQLRARRWTLAMLMLVGFQLVTHVAFGLYAAIHPDGVSDRGYKFALNVSYIAQCLCAMTPGGLYVFRRLGAGLLSGVRHIRGTHGAKAR